MRVAGGWAWHRNPQQMVQPALLLNIDVASALFCPKGSFALECAKILYVSEPLQGREGQPTHNVISRLARHLPEDRRKILSKLGRIKVTFVRGYARDEKGRLKGDLEKGQTKKWHVRLGPAAFTGGIAH